MTECKIPLSDGQIALIDQRDFHLVKRFRWYTERNGKRLYAITFLNVGGKRTSLRMHRLIARFPPGQDVDHKNGNGLDNRRSNLRIGSRSENLANLPKRRNTSSRYKGVCRIRTGRWMAYINVRGKRRYLGYFDNEVDAARRYDEVAREHFGEFARLNFPDESADSLCAAERNAEPGKTKTLPLAANRISRVEPFNRLKNGVNTNAR